MCGPKRTPRVGLLVAGLSLIGMLSCASSPPPGAVYVERGPPRERVEVIGPTPAPNFVWMRGYWSWSGGDYVWNPGRWVAVERGYHKWVPGHWVGTRRGWYWVEGHWR